MDRALLVALLKTAGAAEALEVLLVRAVNEAERAAPELVDRLLWFHLVVVRVQGFLINCLGDDS
jgi:hypothetical protein